MSGLKKDPLCGLTEPERRELSRIVRSHAAPAAELALAAMILTVAAGDDYQQADRQVGRRSGDAISHLVVHFNAEDTAAETARIATWSLSTP